MTELPTIRICHTSYENVTVWCPFCRQKNVFNRASDLRSFEPVAGRNVKCLYSECGGHFRIIGDSVNSPYETLIYDCYELLKLKHYVACVLNLCQAFEMFFALAVRVELVYRPFRAAQTKDLDTLHQLLKALYSRIRGHAFGSLRALFLQRTACGSPPKDLAEAAIIIACLPDKPSEPRSRLIEQLENANLRQLLLRVKASKVHKLRNQVVHQHGYRPRRDEVEAALEEARATLFPLGSLLGLKEYSGRYFYIGKV